MNCKQPCTRRSLLEFLGATSLAWASRRVFALPSPPLKQLTIKGLGPSTVPSDELQLAPGLSSHVVIGWGDPINTKGDLFGINNDYIAFMGTDQNSGLMWVNHEAPDPLVLHGGRVLSQKTREQVIVEGRSVGGSLFAVSRDPKSQRWTVDLRGPLNRRWSAETPIPFAGARIAGRGEARGTLGNCAGGITPWQTVLTCEENTDEYYGTVRYTGSKRVVDTSHASLGWNQYFDEPPEHYGWVVEVNPKTATSRKLVSLGRFAHEGATVTVSPQGKVVVYMGDDANDQCVYKFISTGDVKSQDALLTGILYVANLSLGKWIPLDISQDVRLQKAFSNQTDLLVRTREAAAIVGGTPLDRPEGIALHPKTQAVFISLTNNAPKKRPYGTILKIDERLADPTSLDFKWEEYVVGGPKSGFACPDNVIFDDMGNLWFTTDVSGSSLGKGAYTDFPNNGLYVIPASGTGRGKALCIAKAPRGAEFTGPMFTPDYKTLFLSVQHPGEGISKPGMWGSRWPDGGTPRSAVVAIEGLG